MCGAFAVQKLWSLGGHWARHVAGLLVAICFQEIISRSLKSLTFNLEDTLPRC